MCLPQTGFPSLPAPLRAFMLLGMSSPGAAFLSRHPQGVGYDAVPSASASGPLLKDRGAQGGGQCPRREAACVPRHMHSPLLICGQRCSLVPCRLELTDSKHRCLILHSGFIKYSWMGGEGRGGERRVERQLERTSALAALGKHRDFNFVFCSEATTRCFVLMFIPQS